MYIYIYINLSIYLSIYIYIYICVYIYIYAGSTLGVCGHGLLCLTMVAPPLGGV